MQLVKMNIFGERKAVVIMVAASLAFAIVNVLLKKVLDEGMNQFIIVTYRQATSAGFLAPIAYFWERSSFLTFPFCSFFLFVISFLIFCLRL